MSFWRPTTGTQRTVKFWLDCAQSLTIVLALGAALFSYWTYWDTRTRELRKPYDEKKLALYLEAARVAAHLTASPTAQDAAQTGIRFWELYWGELAFVESREIAGGMVAICEKLFAKERCHQNTDSNIGSAISLSHQASREIRDSWIH